MNAANFALDKPNAIAGQKGNGGLHVTITQTVLAISESHSRLRAAENSCLECLAFGAKFEHSLQQSRIGHVGIAGGILLWAVGQHEMTGSAYAALRIPQAKSNAEPTIVLMANGCAAAK